MALDVEVFDVQAEPVPEEPNKECEPTLVSIVTKMSDVFYLNDDTILNKDFVKVIKRDHLHLV